MAIETGDSVTVEYTGRLDDGTVFDTSRESVAEETGLAEAQPDRGFEPFTVEVGAGEVIEGLEEALTEMEEGATETVTIPPEKAYGEWDDDQVREWDPEEFTEMIGGQAPEEGAYLETQQGELAEITHVGEDAVRVDFNHELAGETLEFEVEVVDVS
ncbi:MAG: peptidylprolyl isomerase [Halobacteriaceae archaeon]